MTYDRAEKTFGIFVGLTLCSIPFLIASVCAILYIYTAFIFEAIGKASGDSEQVESYTQASAESYLGIVIPQEATDIHYAAYHVGWQDFEVFLRFSLPGEQLDKFLSQHGVQQSLESDYYPDSFQYGYSRTIEWWQPNQAKTYRGNSSLEDESGTSILIDETNPELLIIYIHGYSY